jgi:hypothetical protein
MSDEAQEPQPPPPPQPSSSRYIHTFLYPCMQHLFFHVIVFYNVSLTMIYRSFTYCMFGSIASLSKSGCFKKFHDFVIPFFINVYWCWVYNCIYFLEIHVYLVAFYIPYYYVHVWNQSDTLILSKLIAFIRITMVHCDSVTLWFC